MANVKITELTEIDASAVTDSDVLPIDDADGGPAVTYKISIGRLRTKVVSPSSNGAESCGTSSLRWAAVYAQNLNVLSSSAPQAQLSYDASNHLQVSVSSAGAVTYNATGASAGHSFSDRITAAAGLTVSSGQTLLAVGQAAFNNATPRSTYATSVPTAASGASGYGFEDGSARGSMWMDSTSFAWKWNTNSVAEAFMVTATGALGLLDGITAPAAVVGKAFLYVDTADGDLKVRFGDGTTKTIATDT